MIDPSDKEYKATKLIRQGKAAMSPPFSTLADIIGNCYRVAPLNIYYDVLLHGNRPRIQVIFEYYRDSKLFLDPTTINFDARKQNFIANEFTRLAADFPTYKTDGILVVFANFESVAGLEANQKINKKNLKDLQSVLALPDLWEIKQTLSSAAFVFYTEDQRAAHETDGVKDMLTTQYFNLLKQHDEFNYRSKDSFGILTDSKENFERSYEGNWSYYFRDH